MIRSMLASARSVLLVGVTAGSVLCAGCGGDDLTRRYSASGSVTYKGEPLESGEIIFAPVDPNQGFAASAVIQNGSFTLTTMTEKDGAVPGQYKVAVTSRDIDVAKLKSASGRLTTNPAVLGKAIRSAKSLVPKKYESSSSSPLTAEVKPQSNSFSFDLVD